MKKKIITLLSILACTVLMASCNLTQSSDKQELPDEVRTLVETYMDAYKISTNESIQYAHFENAFKKGAYLESEEKLLDYIIESIEQINDNLFAFTILVKTTQTDGNYLRVYNFSAQIDGKWYYINGIGNIPEDLKDNLDEEKYSYMAG